MPDDPPPPAHDDGGDEPRPALPDKPPLLDYPSRPTQPPELDTEPWPDVLRAMAVVFGIMLALFTVIFGFCGVLGRGCG